MICFLVLVSTFSVVHAVKFCAGYCSWYVNVVISANLHVASKGCLSWAWTSLVKAFETLSRYETMYSVASFAVSF